MQVILWDKNTSPKPLQKEDPYTLALQGGVVCSKSCPQKRVSCYGIIATLVTTLTVECNTPSRLSTKRGFPHECRNYVCTSYKGVRSCTRSRANHSFKATTCNVSTPPPPPYILYALTKSSQNGCSTSHNIYMTTWPPLSHNTTFTFSAPRKFPQKNKNKPNVHHFQPAILGPEMAAPIWWAPGTFGSFCRKTSMPVKFLTCDMHTHSEVNPLGKTLLYLFACRCRPARRIHWAHWDWGLPFGQPPGPTCTASDASGMTLQSWEFKFEPENPNSKSMNLRKKAGFRRFQKERLKACKTKLFAQKMCQNALLCTFARSFWNRRKPHSVRRLMFCCLGSLVRTETHNSNQKSLWKLLQNTRGVADMGFPMKEVPKQFSRAITWITSKSRPTSRLCYWQAIFRASESNSQHLCMLECHQLAYAITLLLPLHTWFDHECVVQLLVYVCQFSVLGER